MFQKKSLLLLSIFALLTWSSQSVVLGACTDDTWVAVSNTNAPTARELHTAVWTGTEMIIWGGVLNFSTAVLNTGGRYNPTTDSWTATSLTNAPEARYDHTAVWTGSKMIVWGGFGFDSNNVVHTGGIYDPSSNTWTPISTIDAPAARTRHSAVWTGTEMLIWGGTNGGSTYFNDGARYNPSTDTWDDLATAKAPDARAYHTAIWTGKEMIIWGGYPDFAQSGGRYNPSLDSWKPTTLKSAPAGRYLHSAIWTGRQMIVWGGAFFDEDFPFLNTGGRYRNTWRPTTVVDSPTPRAEHTAIWTGDEMIIWGGKGDRSQEQLPDYDVIGGRYDPATNSWIPTSPTSAPEPRKWHTAVWTGQEMIIWGGLSDLGTLSTGARYCAN